ncbi:NHS-like protein 2 isoform X2 [Rhinatrema bivittatum]|uniref:NHS-like protein 2 isoform X2 n=1 Tax=Rhinatrema bivittatum TaxID=194408 RepID=UPI00112EA722|nr:NHS-like protein 2 isoform X2 [Rhinatrema bivittatum]
MPFYKRTVVPGRLWLRPAAPVRELGDVCGLAAVSLLRQLAELCGHSLAMLGELEEHLLALRCRARRLEQRMSRLCALLAGRRGPQQPGRTEQAGSNLDPESKKTAHSKLSWQQPVNVFLASGRPPCVEELHQEAQLNLQSLLQEEYEERYVDIKVTGETFRYCSHSPTQGFTPEIGHKQPVKRLEFVYLPTTRRVSEDETTTVGVRPRESCLSLPTTPDKQKNWSKVFPLSIPEESRWHQSSSIQANIIPINVSGELFDKHASSHHSLFNTETAVNPKSTLRRRRTIIGFPNLSLQDQGNSNGPTSSQHSTAVVEAPSSCFISEVAHGRNSLGQGTAHHPFPPPLRKTYSDLGQSVQARFHRSPTKMDSAGMVYASPSCNGEKDSAFSPSWQGNSFSYMTPSSPVLDSNNQANESRKCSSQCKSRVPLSMASPVDYEDGSSFFEAKDDQLKSNRADLTPTAENPRLDPVSYLPSHLEEQEPPNLQANTDDCIFRERSLSMPTDSGSLSSVDIMYTENRRGSGNYALNYPSGSSDGSASTENVSIGNEQENRQRQRTRSISLKKAKKKPSPPMRSVSLIKDGNVQKLETSTSLSKDQRPKSLCIPLDHQRENHIHMYAQGNTTIPIPKDTENMHFSHHWYLTEWKSNDPYRSLSSSSTATGTTVIECTKTCESSESLDSPSVSRATTPSQFSTEPDSKISSPGRPPGLMSPSSGYSSQSETPTPTIPVSFILGHSPHQTKVRPLVPERKSSLPATSPMERSPKSRLPFELPVTPPTHLDLSGLRKSSKGKIKASRHHSDSTFGFKLSQKTSPIQPLMPMVTQSDLRSVRLRSVSKSEPEDNADGLDPPDEQIDEAFPLMEKKVKPPVAEKPPLSKRRPNLIRSPNVSQDSVMTLPITPLTPGPNAKEKVPPQDIYMVIRKTKHKKNFDSGNPAESVSLVGPSSPPQSSLRRVPSGLRQVSQGKEEGEENFKLKPLPERITIQGLGDMEKKKGKIPPPIPKKPSLLYLPLAIPPPNPVPSTPDQRLTPSPVITVGTDSTCFPAINDFHSSDVRENNSHVQAESHSMSLGNISGSSMEAIAEEKNFVSDKTAESIAEDDDDVFMTSRTTEDLFTVIHRSKRKLLGWKDPGDAFSSRQSSLSPVKNTPESPTNESPTGGGGSLKSCSKNEDFKALLQRKGSKTSLGSRTSAAELLKTTNPLARRVLTEFAPELENTACSKPQP